MGVAKGVEVEVGSGLLGGVGTSVEVGAVVAVGFGEAVGTIVAVGEITAAVGTGVEVSAGADELPPQATANTVTARITNPHPVLSAKITKNISWISGILTHRHRVV